MNQNWSSINGYFGEKLEPRKSRGLTDQQKQFHANSGLSSLVDLSKSTQLEEKIKQKINLNF